MTNLVLAIPKNFVMVNFLKIKKSVRPFLTPGEKMNLQTAFKSLTALPIAVCVTLSFASTAIAGSDIKLRTTTISTMRGQSQDVKESAVGTTTEWIVQFRNHISETNKKSLTKAGLRPVGYLPEDALIVRGTQAQLQTLSFEEIQAVVPFTAPMKISPEINLLTSVTLFAEKFIVSVFDARDMDFALAQLKLMNVHVIAAAGTSMLIETKKSALNAVAQIVGVEHIQPAHVVEPLHFKVDPSDLSDVRVSAVADYSDINGSETGTQVMNFETAWQLNYLGQNQVVGMADTGLDSGDSVAIHPDFGGGVKSGYAVGLFGKTWADPMGHGTHVAGSVMGRGAVSGGKLKGAAHAAKMVAQGMWSPVLNNLSVPADLGKMFSQAYADGARVHTNSWGAAATFGTYEKMAATVDQVMFEKQDLLVIFAAGNSGVDKNRDGRIDANSIATPGTAKNALTVGASENLTTSGGIQKKIGELASAKDNWPVAPITLSTMSDTVNGLAMFSSRGPTSDGRIKPDIVAPGTNILSVKSQQPTAEKLWGEYNPNYVWSGGTSMAAPLAAGAAAVARQILIETITPNPSAALLKAYLMQTATEMFPGQYGQAGANQGQEILTLRPNNDEGYGRVNVSQITKADAILYFADNRTGLATAETFTAKFVVPRKGKLVANLVWTDAPGSPNAAKALVNDLDLKLTFSNGFNEQSLNSNDQINNHAFAQADVEAGTDVSILVTGVNVPMGLSGKQPFALIVSLQ